MRGWVWPLPFTCRYDTKARLGAETSTNLLIRRGPRLGPITPVAFRAFRPSTSREKTHSATRALSTRIAVRCSTNNQDASRLGLPITYLEAGPRLQIGILAEPRV